MEFYDVENQIYGIIPNGNTMDVGDTFTTANGRTYVIEDIIDGELWVAQTEVIND